MTERRGSVWPSEHGSERSIVDRARLGDQEAQEVLYQHYYPRIFNYMLRRTGSAEKSEDFAQNVSISVFVEKIGQFQWQPDAPFSAWVFKVSRNHLTDEIRKELRRAKTSPLDENYRFDSVGFEEQVESHLLAQMVLRKIQDLSPLQREVIESRFQDELTVTETAKKVGTSDGSVKSTQHAGTNNLRESLARDGFKDILGLPINTRMKSTDSIRLLPESRINREILSARQISVVDLIKHGQDVMQIANTLDISSRTVYNAIAGITRKMRLK